MSANLVWQRRTLTNGLTVLSYPRLSTNTAQLSVTVNYGSNHEPPKAAGITHFLEHMLAGGSEKRIKLSRSIEDCGGVLDLFTDHEQVSATLDVLPEKLPEELNAKSYSMNLPNSMMTQLSGLKSCFLKTYSKNTPLDVP
jgi:predicted Zn-dependent peptidase